MSMTIRFNNPNVTLTSIIVYRSDAAINLQALPEPLATISGQATQFVDETAVIGETYHYVFASVRNEEVLYSAEQVLTAVHQSGPGSNVWIAGNRDIGYYGTITPANLISGEDLATALGLTAGTAINPTSPWLKYSFVGKTLLVAQQPLRHSISWDDLNALGLVDGSAEPITIAGRQFRVRLLGGANTNPSVGDVGYDTMATHGSEWNELLYPTHATVVPSQPFENWANLTDAQLGVAFSSGQGTYTWCQEVGATADERVQRGYFGLTYFRTDNKAAATVQHGWRPVLELID